MQKFTFLCLLLVGCTAVQAQHRVTFILRQVPAVAASEKVYLAGNFNNWSPGNGAYAFRDSAGVKLLSLLLPRGAYAYKCTRGDWLRVETRKNGTALDNRTVRVEKDTVMNISIEGWADHFPAARKRSTANRHVRVLDTAFYMPQLKRHRRIWIYLPESYGTTRKAFPVLYMQDGQNVFDESSSFSGEWGVDEALDTLQPGTEECIVVAIDNGGERRINEYAPYDMEQYGKGEGDLYVDFLAKTLKPYIDKHYRTKKGRQHCFVAGSSLGGLISFYALLKYPGTFGGAGVFSPAFWIAPRLQEAVEQRARKVKGKIYFYAGKQESERMVPDMLAVFEQMSRLSGARMTTVIREEGKHAEPTWRHEFPLFYQWLMKED